MEIAVAYDDAPERGAVRALGLVFLAGLPAIAALALVGGRLLAGRLLAPVVAMADAARRITSERLDERLPAGNPDDEFGRLAAAFNDTLARLGRSFEQLRRFTADASHELRTPLAAIRSAGEVALRRGAEAPALRQALGSVLEEVDRLARLVENLLFLTRADAGALRPTAAPVDLAKLAHVTADLVRILAEEKQQTLEVRAHGEARAFADPDLVRQALLILLDNAIRYTPERGTVTVRVGPRPGDRCCVEVCDTGPGIPEPARARLFERFHRVDEARSRDTGGSGLGLAIARSAVEATGGRLEHEPRPKGGSVFRMELPSAPPPRIAATEAR
jgi:heavy metal sensor kinase